MTLQDLSKYRQGLIDYITSHEAKTLSEEKRLAVWREIGRCDHWVEERTSPIIWGEMEINQYKQALRTG
jgi:hypothetical protein